MVVLLTLQGRINLAKGGNFTLSIYLSRSSVSLFPTTKKPTCIHRVRHAGLKLTFLAPLFETMLYFFKNFSFDSKIDILARI